MARVGWVFQGRGKLCWSYKKTTIVICCFNFVAALYILRSLYTSFCIYSNNASHNSARYTEYQIRKMEESIRVRKAAEPIELIKVVKEIEKELAREDSVEELSKSVKLNIADEILERLKARSENVTDQREALQTWRNEKLEEVKQLQLGNKTLYSNTSAKDTELLRRALEFAWNLLLEDIGVWLPAEVIHKEHDDKPEGDEELEDQIIPGPPLPSECNTEQRTDYGGAAVRWGLTHHKETAADCCQACLDQSKNAKEGEIKCNIWVYCPSENGCHSPDIYEHKHQECWLKQFPLLTSVTMIFENTRNTREATGQFIEDTFRLCCPSCLLHGAVCSCNVVTIDGPEKPRVPWKNDKPKFHFSAERPKVTFKHRYSDSYRNSHPSAPQFVPWVAGVLSAS